MKCKCLRPITKIAERHFKKYKECPVCSKALTADEYDLQEELENK